MIKVLTGLARLTVVLFKLMLILFLYWESLDSRYQPVTVAVSLMCFWWVWRVADSRWRRSLATIGLAAILVGCACHTRSRHFYSEFDMHRQKAQALFWTHVCNNYENAGLGAAVAGAVLLAVADTGSLPFRRRVPRGAEDVGPDAVWPPPPRRLG